MSNFSPEMLGLLGALAVAFMTLIGVLIKNRRDDAAVARDLRDELRAENVLLKEANQAKREENELLRAENKLLQDAREIELTKNSALLERVGALEKIVQALRTEQAAWLDKRADYKMALVSRDQQITDLRTEVAVLSYRVGEISEVSPCE